MEIKVKPLEDWKRVTPPSESPFRARDIDSWAIEYELEGDRVTCHICGESTDHYVSIRIGDSIFLICENCILDSSDSFLGEHAQRNT